MELLTDRVSYWANGDRLGDVVDHGLIPVEILPEFGRHHRYLEVQIRTFNINTSFHC